MQQSKYSRRVIAGFIVVLVVAIGGFLGYRQYQQRNADVLSQMKLKFTGYAYLQKAFLLQSFVED